MGRWARWRALPQTAAPDSVRVHVCCVFVFACENYIHRYASFLSTCTYDESLLLGFYNAHLVPTGANAMAIQLRRLSSSCLPLADAIAIVTGGFNVFAPGQGRLDLTTGQLFWEKSPLVDFIGVELEDLHEIIPQGILAGAVQRRAAPAIVEA